MRQSHPKESLKRLCALFGVSRQAFYDAQVYEHKSSIAHMITLTLVRDVRKDIPMLGTRKLHFMLSAELTRHGMKMGRDKLFNLLGFYGVLIRRRCRKVKTTDSQHWLKKYPNLIKDIELTGPEQLWVSDITYIRTLQGFSYLSLITDAYSRKIVGHALSSTLEATGPLEALEMALAERKGASPERLIHHSDRGVQYCCWDYVQILQKSFISISMTQSGSPYDNALAERVNGILKTDFFPQKMYTHHNEAKSAIDKIIAIYNCVRPHTSIDYLTPEIAHEKQGEIPKRWKKYPRYKKKEVSTMNEP